MLPRTKTVLAAVVAGAAAFGVTDAKAKSGKATARPQPGKSTRTPQRSAPVSLPGQYRAPSYQNDWDGWVPPPAHAGGVG